MLNRSNRREIISIVVSHNNIFEIDLLGKRIRAAKDKKRESSLYLVVLIVVMSNVCVSFDRR